MKRLLSIALLAAMLLPLGVRAQSAGISVTIGDSNSSGTSYYYPVNNYYRYTLTQTIIDAAELQQAMTITGIDYYYNSASATTQKSNVSIYLQPTTKTTFASSTDVEALGPDAVLVYTGPLNCTQGWNHFAFTNTFDYDGNSNLMVIVDDNSYAYDGSSYTFRTSTCTGSKTLYYYSDSADPDVNSPSSYSGNKSTATSRVVMRIHGEEPTGCTRPHVTIGTIDATSAELTVDLDDGISSYEYVYGLKGFTPDWTEAVTGTSSTLTISNLDAYTEYEVYLRSICDVDSVSGFVRRQFQTEYDCDGMLYRPFTIGTGSSSSNNYTFYGSTSYGHGASWNIFSANEFEDANVYSGPIHGIALNYASTDQRARFKIYMANTTVNDFATGDDTVDRATMTLVYDGSRLFTSGWNEILFDSAFTYDGTSNVMMLIVRDSAVGGTMNFQYSSYSSLYRTVYRYGSAGLTSGSRTTSRDNVRFIMCTEPPSCMPVENLVCDSTDFTTAYLSWDDEYNSGASYEVTYVNLLTGDTNTVTANGSPYELGNLTSGTPYYVSVTVDCGNETSQRLRATVFITDTLCYPVVNLRAESIARTSVGLVWDFVTGRGIEPSGVTVTLHDMADGSDDSNDQTLTTDGTSCFFSNLEMSHNYRVSVVTECSGESAPAATITFSTQGCDGTVIDGTTAISFSPVYTSESYSYNQNLFLSSEVSDPVINGLSYKVASTSATTSKLVRIYMANTNLTTLSASSYVPFSELTLVADSVEISMANAGWVSVAFDSAFHNDGRNLVIAVHNISGTAGSGTWRGRSINNRAIYMHTLGAGVSPSTVTSFSTTGYLPAIKFSSPCDDDQCLAPNVMLTSRTTEELHISWVPGNNETSWEVEYRPATSNSWTTAASNVTDTGYTIDNLNAATAYFVRVGSLCSDGDTLYRTIEAHTACGEVSVPWIEDFEVYSASGSASTTSVFNNECWNVLDRYSANYPYISNSQHHGDGSNSFYLYASAAHPTIVSLPTFEDELSDLEMSLWVRNANSGYGVVVGYMTNPDVASTFVPVDTLVPAATSTWEEFVVNFPDDATGRIAMRNVGGWYCYIDDIDVHTAPSCDRIAGFTVDNIAAYTADVHIDDPAEVNNYVILAIDNNGDTLDFTSTDTMYTISGLSANTVYTVSVYTDCGDGTTTAPRVSDAFRTNCAPIDSLPYTYDFDDATGSGSSYEIDPCWQRHAVGTTTRYPQPSNSYRHGTSGYSLYYYSTSSISNYAVLPEMDESFTDITVSFWAYKTSSTYGHVSVGLMTDPDSVGTFSPVATMQVSATSTWEYFEVPLTGYNAGTDRIAIMAPNTSATNYVYVDDVTIMVTPSCERVQSLAISSISDDGATLTIGDSTEVNNYSVTLSSANTTIVIAATDTIVVFEDLDANTEYSVMVSSICDDGTVNTPVTTSFKTFCVGIDSLPWTENFESYSGLGNIYNGSSAIPCWDFTAAPNNYWAISTTSERVRGTRSLQFNPYSVIAPHIVVLPPFDEEISGLEMSIWIQAEGASSGTLNIGYITNPNDISTFVPSFSVTSTVTIPEDVWEQVFVTFAGAPEGARIAIRQMTTSTNWYWWIDDIDVHVMPDCTMPVITVSDVTSEDATVSLVDANNIGSYAVALYANGSLVDSTTCTGDLTYSTLTPNTHYTIYAYTICADGMTDAATATFHTECGEITNLPWTENFDNLTANVAPNCWNVLNGNITVRNSSSLAHSGNNFLDFRGTYRNIIALPNIGDDVSGYTLAFWTRPESTSSSCGSFSVGYLPNYPDTTGFVAMETYNYSDFGSTVTYQYKEINLANVPEGAKMAFIQNANATNYYWYVDDVTVMVSPLCMRPQGVTVSNISTDGADLTVADSNNNDNYLVIVSNGTTADTIIESSTDITLTDLQPGTYYTVQVASICSDGNPTNFVYTQFFTNCGTISDLPWTENFDTWTTGSNGIHPCWSRFYMGGTTLYTTSYPYVNSGTLAHSGSQYMYNYTYGGSSKYYSVFYLPEFSADINTLSVSFFLNPNSASYYNGVRVAVGVSDSAMTDTTTFTRLATFASTQNAWEEFEADLSAYTGNGGRITFVVYGTTSNYVYPYIDDITVDVLSDCRRPSVVEVADLTNTSATISWVDASLAGNYRVTWYDATGTAIDSADVTGDTVYTITGLTAGTAYTVGVSSLCNGEYTRVRTVSLTTATCALLTRADLPLVETFDSYTASTSATIDNCWYKFSLSGTAYYPYPYSSTHHGTTGNSMYFYAYDAERANYLVLPGYDTVANLNLRFWMYRSNSYAQVEVGVMTDPHNASSFTPIQAFAPSATSTWDEVDIDLNGYSGQGHFVALRVYCTNTTSAYSFYIDDVTLSSISSCPRPNSVTASNITMTSADITVNDAAELNHYRLWWGDSDSVDITTDSYTINGLGGSTSYTVTVAAICPDGSLTNTRSVTFRTLCGNISYSSLPWFESFETYGLNVRDTAAALSCWSFIHPHGETTYSSNGYCYVTNSYPVTGTYSLRFSGYAPTPMVAVLPPFDASIANLKMSFHLRAENSNAYDGTTNSPGAIRIGYMTDPTDSTTFVQTARFECTSGRFTSMTMDSATFAGAPAGARIAIEQVNNNTNYWWWIDDITVSLDQNTPTPQYTVSVSSADATMGTASCTPSGSVDAGTSVTATATANDGYHFVSWTDAAGAVVSTANPYTFTVTADVTLTATFEANSTPTYYTVTVSSANTTMGTVSCTPSGSVEAGTSVTATATPANNHIFTGWVDANGDTVSRANPYTFTVTADVTLVGTFRYDGVGIDEAEVSNVSLFPNPATNTFTVSATGMKEATVIDLNGRTVMTQSAADGTATFDVSTLAKGTYFVRIVGEQATAVRKLVVK
ncbi:MAG: fibronectin type III domain-containing protein [Bacteroidales bacterium]|nr:fibronectin type III domain-containing protein [Bacteroidales bacterium]